MTVTALKELEQRLANLAGAGVTEKIDALYDGTHRAVGERKWVPNPGPQTEAYYSPADVLLYGGQGGGGKSDLGLGLAFSGPHRRALILRRKYTNLGGLIDRAKEINGGSEGFNGSPPPKFRLPDRLIEFGANQHLGDEQDFQGIPFDLKVFDEAVQFLEAQVRFHLGWMRSTFAMTSEPSGQREHAQRASGNAVRVRAVLATNPRSTAPATGSSACSAPGSTSPIRSRPGPGSCASSSPRPTAAISKWRGLRRSSFPGASSSRCRAHSSRRSFPTIRS